jgi:hypothetical protein
LVDYSKSRAVGSELGLLAASGEAYNKRREVIRRFLWAYLSAEEKMAKDSNLFINTYSAYTGLPLEVTRESHKLIKLGGGEPQPRGDVTAHVTLASPEVEILAFQRYTLELQPTPQVLRSTAELQVGSSAETASATLLVSRACVPAIVVVLRSSVQRPGEALAGGSAQHGAQPAQALPVGLRVRVMHTALRHVVAETTTA